MNLSFNKYFLLSGVVALALILFIGNYSIESGVIAGFWLGFWGGVALQRDKKLF